MAKYLKLYNNLKEKIDKILLNSNEIPNAPYINLTNNDGHVYFSEIIENKRFYDKLDYEEVEYLENTSTAYIDTGLYSYYNQNDSIKHECEISYSTIVNSERQLQASNGGGGWYGITADGRFEISSAESEIYAQPNIYYKQTYIITKSGSTNNLSLAINDETILTSTSSTALTCYPIYIFGLGHYNVSAIIYHVLCKLKYYKIYFGNKLVRDFVPVRQIYTGKYGLFDKVENKFYLSANGVSFTGGTGTGIKHVAKVNTESYLQVEYINNPSTAFINTWAIITNKTRIEAEIKVNSKIAQIRLFGADDPKIIEYIYTNGSSNSSTLFAYAQRDVTDSTDWISTTVYSANKVKFILDGSTHKGNSANNKGLTIYNADGSLLKYTAPKQTINNASGQTPIFICCANMANSAQYSKLSIYSFKVIDTTNTTQDRIVRDMVPVIRLSDKRYGLYDKVEGKFYDSPNGIAFQGSTNYITDSQGNYITYQENNDL